MGMSCAMMRRTEEPTLRICSATKARWPASLRGHERRYRHRWAHLRRRSRGDRRGIRRALLRSAS